jgi:hypothetical protein
MVVMMVMMALPAVFTSASAQDASQNQATALMRGYRTGYSDGYPAGVQDSAKRADKNFRAKLAYQSADRAYAPAHGSLDEYRNGYRQGFEAGYGDGYDRKNFDSTIPDNLAIRDATDDSQAPVLTNTNRQEDDNAPITNTNTNTNATTSTGPVVIPRDTIMKVELLSNLATDASHQGDHFEVKVLEPAEFQDAVISGTVTRVQRPGKVKGTAELQLSFEQIRLSDGRSTQMSAQVIEVIPTGTSQGVGNVDQEGGVKGKDSTKGDVAKVGAATGIGAVIGAIFGGGSGAAVGATIGAGAGTAGVMRERGKDIYLYSGQQLKIRTAGEAEIQ